MKIAKTALPIVALLAIAIFCTCFFSACLDADFTKVEDKLRDDKGYIVSVQENTDIAGCTQIIKAAKNQDGDRTDFEYVRLVFFKDVDSAMEYYKTEFKETYDRLTEEDPLYGYMGKVETKRVGNVVLYGTPGGIKDAMA